jgi:hypothetical protein
VKVGDMVKGFVPIKWQENVREEDVIYPGLKSITGMIIDKNEPAGRVLVLIDGSTWWWHIRNTEVISENR